MAPDQLRDVLRRQPFCPFRLIMSNGETHDVVGPERMLVTSRSTVVAVIGSVWKKHGESEDGDVLLWLENDLIVEAKPIEGEH